MTLPVYSYYEIKIILPGNNAWESARVSDFLSARGIASGEIAFCQTETESFAAAYTRSLKAVNQIRGAWRSELGKGYRFKSRLLVREDWFDKWQLDYQIMPLGKTFTLVPLWHQKKYRLSAKRRPIFLDPKGASGSGQHPTTQMMAEFLEAIAGRFDDCLDLGAGTGILGILAAKLGARTITAVDNDSVAVKAARFNLKFNQVPAFEVTSLDVTQDKKTPKRYSLVCANLISPVLDSIRKELFASVKPGGYLAVSGIHVQNFDWFRKRFRDRRFRCLKITKKRGWSGFLFKRR